VNSASSRVAMLVAPKRIELRSEAIPEAPPGGIVVRVRAALTDGTDLKTYRRGHPKMPMPTRFGHEFCGDVALVGRDVTAFRVGDAVMCTHTGPCGECFWCRNGQEELCDSIMPAMVLGAYSDFVALPKRIVDRNCYHKPADVSYPEGAFLEPLSCVMHSLAMLAPARPSTAVVLGNGAFGVLHALLLERQGVEVLLFGRRAQRVAFARELGLESFYTGEVAMRDLVLERSAGRGADAVIECTGSPEMWESAPSYARRGGTVSFFAGLPSEVRVSFLAARLHYDEIRLLAPFHFAPADVRAAFDEIAAHGLPLRQMITHTSSLTDIVATFERLDAGEGIKALIEP